MPRIKQTEAEMEAKRSEIINGALEIMLSDGFDAISIRSIAEKIGLSHMTLYTYFENREALIDALVKKQHEDLLIRHEDYLQQAAEGDFRELLDTLFKKFQSFAKRKSTIRMLIADQGDRSKKCAHRMKPSIDFLADIIRIGTERGITHERDTGMAAILVLGLLNSPVFMCADREDIDPEYQEQINTEARDLAKAYLLIDHPLPG